MSFAVQTPVFEGPLDLLLHLILREQVDLYEVSLSTIVDAYLAQLAQMGELDHLDLEIATEFLLIATTLVALKAARLLPGEERIDLDDELSLWEERDMLLARLLECKTFKDAALVLMRMEAQASRSFPRTAGLEDRFVLLAPDPLSSTTPKQLRDAYIRAVTPRPVPRVEIAHIHSVKLSVSEACEELAYELPRLGRVTFRRLTANFVEKVELVVRFLAVLEMYKQGLVDIDQSQNFGDIEITWLGADHARADLQLLDAYEG
jgi:segregation and condensation protein A